MFKHLPTDMTTGRQTGAADIPVDCGGDSIAALRQMFVDMVMGRRVAAGQAPVLRADLLRQFLTGFSRLVVEQRSIKELTINPLLVSNKRVIALDARVVLHDPSVQVEQLPTPILLQDGTPTLGSHD